MSKLLHIVMLHNRYQYTGGEDVSVDIDVKLLREYGHRVTLIEAHNDTIKEYSQLNKFKLFTRTAWNSKVYREMRSQLQELRPDLVHVQNFFPLFSPSIHAAARSLNIPTVQHLHNFRLGCLNGYLLKNGKICESCVGRNPWRGVIYGCYRNSPIASLAVWSMVSFNRWRRTWWQDVDAFIAPSHFAAQKLKEIGINGNCIYVRPNAIEPIAREVLLPLVMGNPQFVYVGRLSSEKGVMMLLQAWAELNMADWRLKIVGDGSEKFKLECFVVDKGLKNVQFLGYLPPSEIASVMKSVTAIVVPSQCYETFGRVIVEAFACSKPVLASDLGALSELISPQYNGFLIPHNIVSAWVDCLRWCGNHPEEMQIMGNNAYSVYQELYTRLTNYQQLMEVYNCVLRIGGE